MAVLHQIPAHSWVPFDFFSPFSPHIHDSFSELTDIKDSYVHSAHSLSLCFQRKKVWKKKNNPLGRVPSTNVMNFKDRNPRNTFHLLSLREVLPLGHLSSQRFKRFCQAFGCVGLGESSARHAGCLRLQLSDGPQLPLAN